MLEKVDYNELQAAFREAQLSSTEDNTSVSLDFPISAFFGKLTQKKGKKAKKEQDAIAKEMLRQLAEKKAQHMAEIRERHQLKMKKEEIEYRTVQAERILLGIILENKGKYENEIWNLEHQFGKERVKELVRHSTMDCESILRSGMTKAYGVAGDVSTMIKTQDIKTILLYAATEVGKIVKNSKNEFNEVLKGLKDFRETGNTDDIAIYS